MLYIQINLFVPHAAIHILYLYTKYWINNRGYELRYEKWRVCKQLGMIIVVWHRPAIRYKVSEGLGAARHV